MTAYYNENNPFTAQWLENLIGEGLIARGEVDRRSIEEVTPNDLRGYTQHHFFAGIGGWSFALKLAGWPDTKPVWTGSCPCQPFSHAGQQKGFQDQRHLWPVWYSLISQCKPSIIFGEQVAKSLGWFDQVSHDLESSSYAIGAADIPAIGIGARHIRHRLWFVADANQQGWANAERIDAPQTQANSREAVSLVHRLPTTDFQWKTEPDEDWIVDGLSGEGHVTSAYGNAIVPQVAAEFIRAYMEAVETRCSA